MEYKIVIKGRLPNLNDYTNANRYNKYAGASMKKETQNNIIMQIKRQLPQKVNTPVWIDFLWVEPNKLRDLDNICFAKKFILDSLVTMEVIPDDGWEYVTGFNDKFAVDKNDPRIEVIITEM